MNDTVIGKPSDVPGSCAGVLLLVSVGPVPCGERPDSILPARIPLSNRFVSSSWQCSGLLLGQQGRGKEVGPGEEPGATGSSPDSSCQHVLLLSDCPHEAYQFPCHGGHGFLTTFASIDESAEAAMQSLVRSLGDRAHAGSHGLATCVDPLRGTGTKAVIPGSLHQNPPRVSVAGSGIPPCRRLPPLECSLGTNPR